MRLHDGGHRRKQERFLIEGRREIERALLAGITIEELYFCPDLYKVADVCGDEQATPEALLAKAAATGASLCEMAQGPFVKISFREGPDGLLAMAVSRERNLEALALSPCPLVMIVEQIEKPGNLGTLLRTAGAAGVDAVVITDPVTDLFNPNVIRASQGVCFSLPIAVTTNALARAWLRTHKITPYATTPAASQNWYQADLRQPAALLLGSEKDGLSSFWLQSPEVQPIGIPMAGLADSLNVAAAAAIVLFEAVRQRNIIVSGQQ